MEEKRVSRGIRIIIAFKTVSAMKISALEMVGLESEPVMFICG